MPESPLSARHGAESITIGDSFLVVGGWEGDICPADASCVAPIEPLLRDGAIFSPGEGSWSTIAEAPVPIGDSKVVNLGDRVYFSTAFLGRDDAPRTFLSYSPATDEWDVLPQPEFEIGQLVTDGQSIISVHSTDEISKAVDAIYTPASNRWDAIPEDPLGASFDRQAVWTGTDFLLTAKELVFSPGSDKPPITRLARFDLSDGTWARLSDSEIIGGNPTSVSGSVVFPQSGAADGGDVNNWGRSYPFGAIYHPDTEQWDPLPVESTPDKVLGGQVVGDRIVLGSTLLNPTTGEREVIPGFPRPDREDAAVASSENLIFVWGGYTGNTDLADGAVFLP